MDMISLTAAARTKDLNAKSIRLAGKVPCVLYGNDTDNIQLECEYSEIFRAFVKAGASTIVELDAAGTKVPVLFHSIDFDPVSDRITHADFYAVDMKKEIEATVPVHVIDEALAVKDLGGVLVTPLDHVTVKCLPVDLPPYLEVSIASLETFSDSVTVADLQVSDKVTVLQDTTTMLATVQEPRREEVEEVPAEEEVAEGEEGAAVEGAEGEGAEGAAAEGSSAEGGKPVRQAQGKKEE